jgi:hypothetical protein
MNVVCVRNEISANRAGVGRESESWRWVGVRWSCRGSSSLKSHNSLSISSHTRRRGVNLRTHLAGVDLLAGESVVVGTHLDGVSVGVGVIVEIRDRG